MWEISKLRRFDRFKIHNMRRYFSEMFLQQDIIERHDLGSGCGTVDRVVVSNTKDQGVKSDISNFLHIYLLFLSGTLV